MIDFSSPIRKVRSVGCIEGVSFLLLMGVAMPLKYLAGQPLAVKYLGWAHGLLFIALCLMIFQAWMGGHLSFKAACLTFIAALLPFGPFIIDRRLATLEAKS
jgi:integral membrane protein